MAPIDGDPMADVLTGLSAPPAPPAPTQPATREAPIGPAPHVEGTPSPGQNLPPVNQPEPGRERMVPLPELLEVRHRYQSERARAEEMAREMAAERERNEQLMEALQRVTAQQQSQQPQPPPIDPNIDPAGALAQMQAQMRAEVQQIRQEAQFTSLNSHLNNSEREARRDFGHQAVDAALDAAMRSGMAEHFRNQADPYSSMVQWHHAQELARAIGPDPRRFVDRIRQEERQRLIAEMRNGAPPPTNLPPSLASATRSADGAPIAVQGSKDFFENMLTNPRTNRGPGGQR